MKDKKEENLLLFKEKEEEHLLFFLECRVYYERMLNDPIANFDAHRRYHDDWSDEDYLDMKTSNLRHYLPYFDFISCLNRYLIYFKNPDDFPKRFEINFYRNKAVEHWTDYVELLEYKKYMPMELNQNTGGCFMPNHFKKASTFVEDKTIIQEIVNEFDQRFEKLSTLFKDKGITLEKITNSTPYEQASKIIFDALKSEDIDKKLIKNYEKKYKEEFELLIKSLFNFCFPLPIHSPKDYAEELIDWSKKYLLKSRLAMLLKLRIKKENSSLGWNNELLGGAGRAVARRRPGQRANQRSAAFVSGMLPS